jgi:hypothetical protein
MSAGTCLLSLGLKKNILAQSPSPGPVDEKEQMAAALGFHKDATKVDVKKWTKKAGADGKSQTCATCQLYTADLAANGQGKCVIFSNRLVPSNGWCNSWVKKA